MKKEEIQLLKKYIRLIVCSFEDSSLEVANKIEDNMNEIEKQLVSLENKKS